MRLALVWNASDRLMDISIRYEPYVEGLRALGAEVITVCPAGTDVGYPYPVRTFSDERQLEESTFWQSLGCQGAAIITYHRMTRVLTAMRAAGIRVLAIGDSDGQMSPRLHPGATLRFMTYLQPTLRGKLGAMKYWTQRFLLHCAAEHAALIENTQAAPVLTLAGMGAVAEFRALLHRIGAAALADRVAWLPYPIPDSFCTGPVVCNRPERVVAVGRWDSPQKNSALLARTLRRLAARGCRPEVLIVGTASRERFRRLTADLPHVRALGTLPRDEIREIMGQSRVLLVTSRWESGPIVAWEMFALGGTVVGTPIPTLRSLAVGASGRTSATHSSRGLATAVSEELTAWRQGERSPLTLAAAWRPLVNPQAVTRRLLDLLELSPAPSALPASVLPASSAATVEA